MSYAVKEVFYTLQGEGANAGRPAVFCRFAGCNLWSGREVDRSTAVCSFCDTDFVGTDGAGGGKFTDAYNLGRAISSYWPEGRSEPFVVFTGGEPLLQLDQALVEEMHSRGFKVAIETNGTMVPPAGVDWICVSPKSTAALRLRAGNELKFVYPQADVEPAQFVDLPFEHRYIQPMDGPECQRNTALAVEYCLQNPEWRLSLQTHKLLGIR